MSSQGAATGGGGKRDAGASTDGERSTAFRERHGASRGHGGHRDRDEGPPATEDAARPPDHPAHAGAGSWFRAVARLALGPRTLREGVYLLLNFPISTALFVFAVTGLSVGAGLLVLFVGLPLLCLVLVAVRGAGFLERTRARALLRLDVPQPRPLRPRAGRRGALAWAGAVLRSGECWRATVYALVHFPWAVFTFCTVVALWSAALGLVSLPLWVWTLEEHHRPGFNVDGQGGGWVWDGPAEYALAVIVGCVLLLLAGGMIRGLAHVDRMLVAGLLGPSAEQSRIEELETNRSVVVDASSADLQRIERDLHDGAQARLVALAMSLGMAKEKLEEDPETAARMVDEAHGEVKMALQELRDLARGIRPAILTDRGLGPSLSAVASRCTVPVGVDVDLPQRPAEAIEGIVYFTVSELLQNVSKHSGGSSAMVDIWRAGEWLMVQVADDGRGGARAEGGTGLAGLADRLEAVDGRLMLSSPEGGPTTVTAALPWRGRA
ncbi:sensor histidine kinase [Streptomyces sp. ST2-7A]|uniref:sensor histidine kinase n=1 Tax=Streptomyces sp. ST2-7A TaxID=2907214 RepID=UPI001F3DB21C|nr:sensor histidine kinase [Streptomyces sp. ST2-7A]MCE7078872.1 sensor domain-containing protein [Streptomyces sp. ST2-7A]